MTASKQEKATVISRPGMSSNQSRFIKLEEAVKKLLRSTITSKNCTVSNALATIQFGTIEMLVPQDYEGDDASVGTVTETGISITTSNTVLLNPPSSYSHPWLKTFSRNIDPPSLSIELPPSGTGHETTAQLAYCNDLLRTYLSPSLAAANIPAALDPSQKAFVDAFMQDKNEQDRVRGLTIRVIEEFAADTLKTSDKISEVILLGPFLVQEHYRRLLNCFIAEFETSTLLDIELLQGLVQLVECAGLDYLQPDDLVRILVVLRTRLQDTRQETTEHPYYLTQALSRLLDVMVEGKVQDLRHVVDHAPLSALLGHLVESTDSYLKHQATYALQGLLHVPDEETRRQYLLRQEGKIVMGLLGVDSVCKLDLGEFKNGVDHLYKAAGDAHEVGTKIISGVRALNAGEHNTFESAKGGLLSCGRRLWYTALREAQEYIRKGRLIDFNRLVFEAPCCLDVEFQWGVCRLLKEITVDPQWDIATRQQAVELLANLYRDDANWTSDDEILVWIITIIRQVASLPDESISDQARSLLHDLEMEGDSAKQALHRQCLTASVSNFPIKLRLSNPQSSLLLLQVLAVPDVEYVLQTLRTQRCKERENVLYIPPQAKPTLTSNDDTLFPLMEKTLEFLAGPGQVLLLLGDSGGGKSTFNLQLEHTLWQDYKRGDPIPLHINLPAISNPQEGMIDKQLQRLRLFSDIQIQELRQSRQIIVICDGYDESQLKKNLYATNLFNQAGQWKAKMIISCRSQYLGPDYRARFQPTVDPYQNLAVGHFREAVIASFSRTQIEQYVEQFVQKPPLYAIDATQPIWTTKEYMNKLVKIPGLIELVSNPFLLTLALRTLPKVVSSQQDFSEIRLTRVGLYDSFTDQWLETNKRRLEGSVLSSEAHATFDNLLEAGFNQYGISYQKDLAAAIFQYQDGAPVVEYTHLRENRTWKAEFFSPETQATILRESSPLTRSGNQYRFLHRSILEYLYSRVISDPSEPNQPPEGGGSAKSEYIESFVSHPLNKRNIVVEPSILQFLAERVDLDSSFKSRLFSAIEESKTDAQVSLAAANAISVLIKAGVRFNGADLRGISIPGADVSGGEFDSADLDGANLRDVNLSKAWLRRANLSDSQMGGVQFGELPYLKMEDTVRTCVFSSDGALLAVSTDDFGISIFDTITWSQIDSYPGGGVIAISPATRELAKGGKDNTIELGDIQTGEPRLIFAGHNDEVTCISFSPDGTQIATASKDTRVRSWSTLSGDTLHILCGHSESVTSVAFSPAGLQIASCSEDMTVRIWNAQTGQALFVLEDHTNRVLYVTYSPDGSRVASGDDKDEVVLWDSYSGERLNSLSSSGGQVFGLAYSPDGQQIASCGEDGNVRLWDVSTCQCISVLSGHLIGATSVTYSPSGDYIASGSWDQTVRLWKVEQALSNAEIGVDTNAWISVDMSPDGAWVVTGDIHNTVQLWETGTGKLGLIMTGHIGGVTGVAFSPCGQRVASASNDTTVRLWCVLTGVSVSVMEGHLGPVMSVAFSHFGHQIVSASRDNTVRIWDTETGAPGHILEGHTNVVNNVAFSANGQLIASCSNDKTIRLWCAETGEQILVLEHSVEVDRVMFSPDEQEFVSVSRRDHKLHCWDMESGERLGELEGLVDDTITCCYSPNGQALANVDMDGLMQIWSLSSGRWLQVFETVVGIAIQIVWWQGFEEQYLVALGFGTMRVWRLTEEKDEYSLQLIWRHGMKELTLMSAELGGVEGLSPVNLKLVKQRSFTTEAGSESSDDEDSDDDEEMLKAFQERRLEDSLGRA
ncbi:WD_REPEATS_REGION domain-containing protein [Linnemannia gamsii]|uniref:WD_REPEATS_REGION domain-containing protein n=1 Tax=Linnemannia gamsii TaxID=64522 RepID=A0A9P6QXA0_9FUNG|nr:WD_REPEATS_REGION domain-containing protein [Linnemannia gamsii]